LRIWACTDTSRALVGSSQTISWRDGQRAGDGDALALAAGELVGKAVAHGRIEADPAQQRVDPWPTGAASGSTPGQHALFQDLADPHARVEGAERVLEDHLQLPPQGLPLARLSSSSSCPP
jgi:hypothetical protein